MLAVFDNNGMQVTDANGHACTPWNNLRKTAVCERTFLGSDTYFGQKLAGVLNKNTENVYNKIPEIKVKYSKPSIKSQEKSRIILKTDKM